MNFGIGKFRLLVSETEYIPSGFELIEPDNEQNKIVRRPPKGYFNKIRAKKNYFNMAAKCKNLTDEEIAWFRIVTGTKGIVFPHIDYPGIYYHVNITKAEISYENKKPWKNVLNLVLEGCENVVLRTTETARTVTVTNPNGGNIVRGYDCVITWTSSNFTSTIEIDLYKGGVFSENIATEQDDDGSYTWSVPSDFTVADDYSIRISDSETGYIYDLSDANFSILYDGYLLFDGSDDYIGTPVTQLTTSGDWSIIIDYNGNGVARPTTEYLLGSYKDNQNSFTIYIDYTQNKLWYFEESDNKAIVTLSTNIVATSAGWQRLIITRSFASAASVVKMYIDSTTDQANTTTNALESPTLTTGQPIDIGRYNVTGGAGYLGNRKLRNVIFYNRILSTAEIASAMAGIIPSSQVALYRGNDADAGTPWTNNVADSSGNANHATPVNINGATFFNQI